jgi:DNA replication and repair protein RecF
VQITDVSPRDFRGYERAQAPVGEAITVITGPNGAGKTNLLEAIYCGCTGRSCRTTSDRELIRFGAPAARVVLRTRSADGEHELAVGIATGEPKHLSIDGTQVERLLDLEARPLVSVFLPDRLDLIKGVPAGRRAHLDQFVTALWPSRSATRRAYAQALAQRNALLSRIRAQGTAAESLEAWDHQLARHALAVMSDRREAVDALVPVFGPMAARLGLDGDAEVSYRPRSSAETVEAFVAELAERRQVDSERGFTGHGPHRDDLLLRRGGRELRAYGSQGQQRLGLLALLLSEREVIAARRHTAPVMLLDDVMSELDTTRRRALVNVLAQTPGQAVITATDAGHVPVTAGPVLGISVLDATLTTDAAGSVIL